MNRPIRLTIYTDAVSVGGAEGSIANLLGALGPRVQPTILGVDREVVDWIARSRPRTTAVAISPVDGKRDVRHILEHVRAVRRLRPDVFQANLRTSWSCQYGIAAAIANRRAKVVTVDQAPIDPAHEIQRRFRRLLSRHVDATVAVGEALARYVGDLTGAPGSVRTIYNSVPDLEVPAAPRFSEDPVVGAIGRLSEEKGLDVLVRAAAVLPGVFFVLVGDGPERRPLERLAEELGVQDRVLITGWDDQPRRYLAGFDVLALPSRLEGFPLVVVEAMLARVPVVASRVGSVPEAVVDGETGLLVPPADHHALAAALRGLLGDPELGARLGVRGRELAVARFTPPAAAAAFEALYEELLR